MGIRRKVNACRERVPRSGIETPTGSNSWRRLSSRRGVVSPDLTVREPHVVRRPPVARSKKTVSPRSYFRPNPILAIGHGLFGRSRQPYYQRKGHQKECSRTIGSQFQGPLTAHDGRLNTRDQHHLKQRTCDVAIFSPTARIFSHRIGYLYPPSNVRGCKSPAGWQRQKSDNIATFSTPSTNAPTRC